MPDLSLRRANSLSHLAQGARKVPEGSLTILPDAAKLIFRGRSLAVQAVFADPPSGRTIVIAAEDNLGKGAAGQAMQNANLALGLPETDGLRLYGVKV